MLGETVVSSFHVICASLYPIFTESQDALAVCGREGRVGSTGEVGLEAPLCRIYKWRLTPLPPQVLPP